MPKSRFSGWWMIGATMITMSAGNAPLAVASLGVFMGPLQREFGWDRAEVSLCSSLLIGSMVFSIAVVGKLVDRFGTRAVLVPSLAAAGIGLAAIPTLATQLGVLWALFLFMGVFGTGTNVVTYMPMLSAWFHRHRGLAIGLAVSGIGLGYSYVPILAQWVIDNYDWRTAYYVLSAIALLVAVPIAQFVLVEKPADKGQYPDGIEGTPPPATSRDVGLETRTALRTREFWVMLAIFFLLTFATYGIFIHLVPMLIDRGMTPQAAAGVASVTGIAVLVARVLIGFLVDRFFAPRVALVAFILCAAGAALLYFGAAGGQAFLAAVMVGLAIGAESDLLAYLSSRYFGLRSLGTIFGLQSAAYMLGTASGPWAFGRGFEATGSYATMLATCIGLVFVAIVLTLVLRRFPDWDGPEVRSAPVDPASMARA
jgi:predicted MFS family arabinose efflux permease